MEKQGYSPPKTLAGSTRDAIRAGALLSVISRSVAIELQARYRLPFARKYGRGFRTARILTEVPGAHWQISEMAIPRSRRRDGGFLCYSVRAAGTASLELHRPKRLPSMGQDLAEAGESALPSSIGPK